MHILKIDHKFKATMDRSMDYSEKLLNDKYLAMFSVLLNSGFSAHQAKNFIPKAVPFLLQSADKQDSNGRYIFEHDDIYMLANKSGIHNLQVSTGLQKLFPIVLKERSNNGIAKLIIKPVKKFFGCSY